MMESNENRVLIFKSNFKMSSFRFRVLNNLLISLIFFQKKHLNFLKSNVLYLTRKNDLTHFFIKLYDFSYCKFILF